MSMSSNDVDMARKKRARHELGGGGGCAEVLDISIGSVQFAEPFNADALAYVVAHWAEVMDKSADDGKKLLPPKRMAELYLSACGAGAGNVAVTYTQNGGRGRWYAAKSRSMQGMKRAVRHVAAAGLYVDVDCVNCYGCVLQWLCAEHALPCPQLDLYVAQRDVLLADLMAKQNGRATSRDYAKKVYIAVMNGGAKDYDGLVCRPEHLQLFQKEMQRLGARLAALFPQRLEQVKARRVAKGKAAAGRADPHICAALMMDLYFEKENEVLECMWRWFGAPTDCVLCFDGIMLSAAHGPYDEQVLAKCEAHVKETTGISMKLKTKPFDEGAALLPTDTADVAGSLRQYLQVKPFSTPHLRRLVRECDLTTIEANLTAAQVRSIADGGKEKRKAIVTCAFRAAAAAAMAYVNQYLFLVCGKSVLYSFVDYDAHGRQSEVLHYKNKSQFLENWDHFRAHNKMVSKKALSVGEMWLSNTDRRIFRSQTFVPGVQLPFVPGEDNVLNKWSGWQYAEEAGFEVDMHLIRRLTFHLREIICGGDAALYSYVLKLWRMILQGQKTGIAVCVCGVQGSGKNLMFEWFGNMVVGERYYAYYSALSDLTSKFSSMRLGRCFIICDELGTWSGDHAGSNFLKGLFTQSKTKAELKGVDATNVDDYANFVLLSNKRNFVKLEGKDDRRYCVMEASEAKKGDAAYFARLCADMGKDPKAGPGLSSAGRAHAHEVGRHFFHLLLQQDLAGFEPEQIPSTRLRESLQLAFTPALTSFVRWFVHEYAQQLDKVVEQKEEKKKTRIRCADIYAGYEGVLAALGHEPQFAATSSLMRRLKRDYPLFADCAAHVHGISYFACADVEALREVEASLDHAFLFDTGFYDGRLALQEDESDESMAARATVLVCSNAHFE